MNLCAHLDKRFDEKLIFSDFSLDVPHGIIAILGPSGCGKTTLFRLLLRLEKPDNGYCSTFRPTGVVFSDLRLIEWLSAFDNICLTCPKAPEKEIHSLLHLLEINEKRQPVSQLSSGQKQRIALARADLFDSPWLLLDEAFRSWDVGLKQRLFPFLRQRWKERKTLTLLITHDLTEAMMLADYLVVFSFPPVSIIESCTLDLSETERSNLSPENLLLKKLQKKLAHYFDPLTLISQSRT